MKTSSAYHSIVQQQEELNKEIVSRVRAAAPVERLYLLGLTTTDHKTESLFSVSSLTRNEVTHCYLLVLVEKGDEHSLTNLQSKIENALQEFLPFTVIVFTIDQICNWLKEGHPFAAAVYEKGFLLYQKEDEPLPHPATVNAEALKKEHDHLVRQTEIRVQEFLAGAELYTIRVRYKMAAFMLHQAAEQTLRTLLILHTGLRINTHSLERLVRLYSMFCPELPPLLLQRNEKEKRVFQLLQKAYIDTRYREDYSIPLVALQCLLENVKRLHAIFYQYTKHC